VRVARTFADWKSHNWIVPPEFPRASVWPSGLNAREITGPIGPLRVARSWGSCADVDGAASRPRKAGIVTGRSSLMEDLFDQINGRG
jgi:hypothetical protein